MNSPLFLFLAAAAILCMIGALVMLLRAFSTFVWKETTGVITRSELEEFPNGRLAPQIEYAYQVNGEDYRGTRVNLLRFGGALMETPERLIARLPIGADVRVRYNRRNPADAALNTSGSVRYAIVLALLGLVFIVLTFTIAFTSGQVTPGG